MLNFYVIRAYSSAGICDLVATPPWNSKGNYRPLLLQLKNSAKKDYVAPFERDHLSYLQQINSGLVLLIYKDNSKPFVKYWENGIVKTIEQFLIDEYGIVIEGYSFILKQYREFKRPIHLYYVERDEDEKPLGPFADYFLHDVYNAHVPDREKHINKV